ncbi:hypothetical protein NQ315_005811 [Exocentrus adspersus]|uniref:C2H2-type domain-containing protein n=1 Tax=Exocentrus adspersus TaxID=1586481 RepID=A0AAV8VRQ1_9CUCU|nr:hypothetical protein NQ315_005811 [Exocentrus adspersus]
MNLEMAQEMQPQTDALPVKLEVDCTRLLKIENVQYIKQEFDSQRNVVWIQSEDKDEAGDNFQNLSLIKAEKELNKSFEEKASTIIQETDAKPIAGNELEKLLVKEENDNGYDENFELSQSDIEKEFEAFNNEDEKANSGETTLENNTTAYKCQMCQAIFIKFLEYKAHKKLHFIEKRRCPTCNIVCQSIGKLQDHLNKHLGLKPFNCDECGKSFISKHHVKLHKRCHNKEKSYKCTQCDKAFRNRGSLRSHQLVHQEKIKEFICKICKEDYLNLPDFRKHMEEHGKKSEIKCGLCNKTFNSDRGLEYHVSFHKELQFPCEYCGRIYPSMYRIKRHIKRAHIPNQCEECNEVFFDRALFTKHRKQHNENKPVECQYCQKKFDKAKNLSEHVRLQHKQDGTMKKCHICDKEFINTSLLKNHVKTHDKCFKCPHCDKVFASRYNLETHSVTHSGARDHKCDICGKGYSTKSSLKNHLATHSEERSFHCDQCSKTFKTNRRLYVHKFSHATEEKFQCDICFQRFRVKQYLKYHMIKHSTVKPFQCEICKKRFKHKKSYEKHMVQGKHKKTETEEHDCDFCDESFATRDLLVDHFAEVHHKENIINNIDECEDMVEENGGDEMMNEEENITGVKVEGRENIRAAVQIKNEQPDS